MSLSTHTMGKQDEYIAIDDDDDDQDGGGDDDDDGHDVMITVM